MSVSAIIAAAGSGERFGAGYPKALIQLGDRTLLAHAINALAGLIGIHPGDLLACLVEVVSSFAKV